MVVNVLLRILMIFAVILSVGGSGCFSPGYHGEMKLAGDTVFIESSQPINISDENSSRVHPLPQDTWMCAVRENETAIEYAFYIDASELSGLDIGMILPDGTKVYAKDFEQKDNGDGEWTVSADHDGIRTITVVPEGESGYSSDDWDSDTLDMAERIKEGKRIEILMCGEKSK